MDFTEQLSDYVLDHIDAEDAYLHRLYRESHLHFVGGHMVSGHLQGVLLGMIVRMTGARRILEIGTFTGYSALSMAKALPDEGLVVTFEANERLEEFTTQQIKGSPWADKVEVYFESALQGVPRRFQQGQDTFDLIFVDGNKREYLDYYELALKYLAPNGLIVADNTLWDGHVVEPQYDKDAQTVAIREFNDFVASDARVTKVILPVRDGLTLIKRV